MYLKKSCMISYTSTWKILSTSYCVDSLKVHSTQHGLFRLSQNWQRELDSESFIGAILMDVSKACECLPHNLLIPKLAGYDLDNGSLDVILNNFSFRKQRNKVGSAYSKWSKIRHGILQGSINIRCTFAQNIS